MSEDGLLEKELSYKVRGCFYNVANKYGKGLKEIIYQKALEEELEKENLKFESQKRIDIYSLETGKKLGTYVPDILVEDKIIVEIKATSFTRVDDINQQRSYLKASKYEIGYLVNFCTQELEIKRSICTNDRKPFIAKLKLNL
jgi:GxxExxY protein